MTILPETILPRCAAAFLILTCPAAAQTGDHAWLSTRELAEERFLEFNYVEASSLYGELLAADSTDYDVLTRLTESWNLLGLDLQSEGKKESAEAGFEHAVKYAEQTRRHHPDRARTFVNLASAYGNTALFRGGRAKVRIGRQVEQFCEEALRFDSTNVIALTILGVFHRELSKLSWIERLVARTLYGGLPKGSIEESVEFLQKAIEVDSTALFPNYSLAVTYSRMKNADAALVQFEKVLRLHAGNSEEARYQVDAAARLAETGK